ncbi:putative transmembrane protein GPR107/GPR108 [Helianthus anomalus]
MISTKIVTAFSLLFFLLTDPSMAEIKSLKIRSDNRPMILFEKMGFTHTSFASVAISSVFVTSSLSQPNPGCLGFFLLSEESLIQVLLELQQNPNLCVVDSSSSRTSTKSLIQVLNKITTINDALKPQPQDPPSEIATCNRP